MGPTLTEGRTDGRSDPSRERDGRGVRRRLWGAVSRLAEYLVDAVAGVFVAAGGPVRGNSEDRGAKKERSPDAVATRPSGQARLESGPAVPRLDQSTDSGNEPEVAARVRGQRLRVYDSENSDAYIASDVYERVKR
jgi:hypothetical protein